MKRLPLRAVGWIVLLLALQAPAVYAEPEPIPPVFSKPAPEHVDDLRAIEQVVRDVLPRLLECTVGVEVGSAKGSGVIVSEDGYVLTAAHVSGQPGRTVRILLPDGTRLEGETLGVHTEADGGLIKINDDGPFPFAPMATSEQAPKVGDWCLAIGHPDGYQRQRGSPVRLGRLIEVYDTALRTDCPITQGDSGGPLFDMYGRVIGIHSRIAEDVTENFHGPVQAMLEAWDALVQGKIYPIRPPSRFLDLLDVDRDGMITRGELPEGASRRVFDRLVDQFDLDPEKPHSIDDLATNVFRWQHNVALRLGNMGRPRPDLSRALLPELYLRGTSVRQPFRDIADRVSASVVRVRANRRSVALGAVLRSDGIVLTKASELRGDIVCRFADGRELPAKIVQVNDQYDLAILQVDATDLTPVEWASSELPAGSWLITPNVRGEVASIGIVSVPPRRIPRATAVLGIELQLETDEARVQRVAPRGGAADAGLEDGDVITRIADKEIKTQTELREALGQFRAGDVVHVTVRRGDEQLEFDVTLSPREDVFTQFGFRGMNGPLSRRRDDFPRVTQHDSTVEPELCGGPVYDISGKAVGVNIARADRISTYAIPYEEIAGFMGPYLSVEQTSHVSEPEPAEEP